MVAVVPRSQLLLLSKSSPCQGGQAGACVCVGAHGCVHASVCVCTGVCMCVSLGWSGVKEVSRVNEKLGQKRVIFGKKEIVLH